MIDYFEAVFLFSVLMGFGYVTATAERLNFFKLALLGLVLSSFISSFYSSNTYLYVMGCSFVFGLVFPKIKQRGLPRINWHSVWRILKPKRKPKEKQRQEKSHQETSDSKYQEQYEEAYQRRKRESEKFRRSQNSKQQHRNKQADKEKVEDNKQNQQNHQQYDQSSTQEYADIETLVRNMHLVTLELEPDREYTKEDIKKAYHRQANRYHPDRHMGKSEAQIKVLNEKFAEIKRAYEWLTKDH